MGKYLITASYTAEGTKGLLKDGGTKRAAAVSTLAESVGGSVESLYYMFGSEDLITVVDVPSDEAAAAIALTVGATGAVSLRTTVLLTAGQIDEATKISPSYRPPGA